MESGLQGSQRPTGAVARPGRKMATRCKTNTIRGEPDTRRNGMSIWCGCGTLLDDANRGDGCRAARTVAMSGRVARGDLPGWAVAMQLHGGGVRRYQGRCGGG